MDKITSDKVNNILHNLKIPSPVEVNSTSSPLNVSRIINKLAPGTPKQKNASKYDSDIDIIKNNSTVEYFNSVKNHRIRATPTRSRTNMVPSTHESTFNPFDKQKLMERVNSFSILNWNIDSDSLTELKCARNGWTCVNGSKNVVKCVTCRSQLNIMIEKYHEEDDEEEYEELKNSVIKTYLNELKKSHLETCPWKNFETPLEIYLINFADLSSLLVDYITRLTTFVDNREILDQFQLSFDPILNEEELKLLKYYSHKNLPIEQTGIELQSPNVTLSVPNSYPDWIYELSLLGWELSSQQFNYQKILLLTCKKCNRRILLGEVKDTTDVNTSSILTPCKYSSTKLQDDDGEKINLLEEHKNWCCYVNSSAKNANKGYQLIYLMIKSLIYDKDLDANDLERVKLVETPRKGVRFIESSTPFGSPSPLRRRLSASLSPINGKQYLRSKLSQITVQDDSMDMESGIHCNDSPINETLISINGDSDRGSREASLSPSKRTIEESLDRLNKLRKVYIERK